MSLNWTVDKNGEFKWGVPINEHKQIQNDLITSIESAISSNIVKNSNITLPDVIGVMELFKHSLIFNYLQEIKKK